MKDLLLYGIYSAAVLASIKVGWMWWVGQLNAGAALEWFLRGYSFALGFLAVMFLALLMVRLIVGGGE